MTGGLFNYKCAQTHLYACRHARQETDTDSGKRKGQMEAAPEKRRGGGQDTGEAANYCTWNKIYGLWKVKNVSLLFYGRERVMVNLLLPTERLKSSSVTTAAS